MRTKNTAAALKAAIQKSDKRCPAPPLLTAGEIIRKKLSHLSQHVFISMSYEEQVSMNLMSLADQLTGYDWSLNLIREGLLRDPSDPPPRKPLPTHSDSTLSFIMTNVDFDSMERKAQEHGMGIRVWIYSLLTAKLEGGAGR